MKNTKNKTSRKTNKKSKKIHKNKNMRRRTRVKGGSCPCSSSKPFLFSKMSGGGSIETPSFTNVPIRSFYPQNSYNHDLQGGQISSRLDLQKPITPNIMNGGKKRRRKMKGGYVVSPQIINSFSDPINPGKDIVSTSGNLSGSIITPSILSSRLI